MADRRGASGFNGRISNRAFGTRRLRVLSLDFGLGIISTSGEARSRRAFYPVVTTGSSFTMTLGFVTWAEREAFNRWMVHFMKQVASGAARNGSMTIQVPSHDFVRVAVPESEIEFGEGNKDVAYSMAVGFMGATDPINTKISQRMAGVSYFRGPKSGADSKYFYPAGKQIAGAESLDGTMFDTNPDLYPGSVAPDESADDRMDRFGADGPVV